MLLVAIFFLIAFTGVIHEGMQKFSINSCMLFL
jgi:hypothetical protein